MEENTHKHTPQKKIYNQTYSEQETQNILY